MSAATGTARAAVIKEITPLSSIVGERVNLRRNGAYYHGCCPFHDDNNPSFWVNDDSGRYGCFGCGVSGDLIDFVMAVEGVEFGDALDQLEAGYTTSRSIVVAPKDRQPRDTVRLALDIWKNAKPIQDTPAELYLESRALPIEFLPDPTFLRFARLSFDGSARLYPALIAAVQTVDGGFAGIQRTFLTEAGRKLDPHNAKRSLGQIRGNAIHVVEGILPDYEHIYVCEGLEDGLSLARMYDVPVLVTAGAGMMRSLALPKGCRRITIGADNDPAGQRAAEEAARAFRGQGVEVDIDTPPWTQKDWNDYVQFWEGRRTGHQIFEDPDFQWARG